MKGPPTRTDVRKPVPQLPRFGKPRPPLVIIDPASTSGNFATTPSLAEKYDACVESWQTFSEFANVCVEPSQASDPKLGTLDQLKQLITSGTTTEIKKFIRRNNWTTGHQIRTELWKELINQNTDIDAQRTIYQDTVQKLKWNSNQSPVHSSYLCIHGRSVVQSEHLLEEKGKLTLVRLLSTVEHLRPDFTCIPVLYPLTALFLHYMNEEESFACVMRLLSQSQKFLLQTDIAAAAARRTLLVLVSKHAGKAYAIFKRTKQFIEEPIDDSLVAIIRDWKAWIFRDLPFSHLVRVVDCFLYEGQKVLFRVALAIVILWQRYRGKTLRSRRDLSTQQIAVDIADFVTTIPISPGKLLKAAFSIRNLKWSQIKALQEKHELALRQSDAGLAKSESAILMQQMSTISYLAAEHKFESQIFTKQQTETLISWIPNRYHIAQPKLLFRLGDQGTSFTTLWNSIDNYAPTLLVIRTRNGEVFGAYCSTDWSSRKKNVKLTYFGTGETFLFQLEPKTQKFDWVGLKSQDGVGYNQELFMAADNTSLFIGGGTSDALSIRDSLENGFTDACDTFANPPLCDGRYFEIMALEVVGFITDET